MDDREARDRAERIEQLLERLDTLPDPAARELGTELVQTLLELYGEGLTRVVAVASEHDAGGALAQGLAADEVVSHLLVLHGLHPVPVEARVQSALEEMRPYLGSHGGDVELVGVEDGVVRLVLQGTCSGCPSSTQTLKHGIEEAIHKAAPDIERIEAQDAPSPQPALLQLEVSPALTCPLPR